jgi:hypothetical protein
VHTRIQRCQRNIIERCLRQHSTVYRALRQAWHLGDAIAVDDVVATEPLVISLSAVPSSRFAAAVPSTDSGRGAAVADVQVKVWGTAVGSSVLSLSRSG